MGKIAKHRLSEAEEEKLRLDFEKMLTMIKKNGDVVEFLGHLLTPSEVIMCARRLYIAKLLMQGFSYPVIEHTLKVGQKTVEGVDRWLSSYREYRTVFPDALEKSRKQKKPVFPNSFADLRRRYPIHFLLFNLLLDEK